MSDLRFSGSLVPHPRFELTGTFVPIFRPHVNRGASLTGYDKMRVGFSRNVDLGLFTCPGQEIPAGRQLHGRILLLPSVGCKRIFLGMRTICELHNRPIPCVACRGAAGGRVSSPRKSAANKLKARHAANVRWGRKENEPAGL